MHIVEKILNDTTPYGKIRASHEGSLHSSTLSKKEKPLPNILKLLTFQIPSRMIHTIIRHYF